MITEKVEKALIGQIEKEEYSSRLYLAMASWCQRNGYQGAADFLYQHSDEERFHMLKMVHYLNDRGGYAQLLAEESKIIDAVDPDLTLIGLKILYNMNR